MSIQTNRTEDTSVTTDDTESACETVKVCSTVWNDPNGTRYLVYLSVFDDSIVVTAGVEPLAPSWSETEARERGIQRSVSHTLDVIRPDQLLVYDYELDGAGLALGRLTPAHRQTVSDIQVTFNNNHNSMYEEVLEGIASFSNRQAPWSHKGGLNAPINNHAYVYTDASRIHNGESAVGYVITDTTGQIYEFGSKPLDESTPRVLVAEFEAILYGIQQAHAREDVRTMTIFSDSMDAVRALTMLGQSDAIPNDATRYPWQIGLEASKLRTVGVSYVNREANELADALAKRGQMASFHLLS